MGLDLSQVVSSVSVLVFYVVVPAGLCLSWGGLGRGQRQGRREQRRARVRFFII